MNSSLTDFESQKGYLTQMLQSLELKLNRVKDQLGSDADNAQLKRQQRQLNLDIRITANELEDIQCKLEACKKSIA